MIWAAARQNGIRLRVGGSQTKGISRLEEAIIEETDMQRSAKMRLHGSQAPRIHHTAGQIPKRVPDMGELMLEPRRSGSGSVVAL